MFLYVCYQDLSKNNLIGVRKKIKAQCCAFGEVLGKVYYTIFAGHTFYLMEKDRIIDKAFSLDKKMCNESVLKWIHQYNILKVYIRYDFSDIWFIDFVRHLKELDIKTVLEFPTIPYDGERGYIRPIEDRYYREQLYQYVECCTTYSDCKSVFNIPCISLVNGVNIEEHRTKQYRDKDGNIVLIAVAAMAKWHGYERIIQGMHEYYSKGGERNIVFYLVGEGGQLSYYRKLVEEYQLQKQVVFYGRLQGEELDKIYDSSDIAIGSLGMYKVNIRFAAPIKLREYCTRGIPFIYGYEDVSFIDEKYFGYRISNDETPVDVRKVIDFYEHIYDGKDFVKDMRRFALEYLTWDKILQPVIEYYNS